jgi:hypothetical protein
MVVVLKVVCIVLVAITLGLALAHALELPGKLRLTREQYTVVQTIYYPGFTVGGFAELAGLVAVLWLVYLMRAQPIRLPLAAASFIALLGVHATYWIYTHPVNRFWLRDAQLSQAGTAFFGSRNGNPQSAAAAWLAYRSRWERSHIVRAVLALLSLICLSVAVAM